MISRVRVVLSLIFAVKNDFIADYCRLIEIKVSAPCCQAENVLERPVEPLPLKTNYGSIKFIFAPIVSKLLV